MKRITKHLWMGFFLLSGPCLAQEEGKKSPEKATLSDFEEPTSWDLTCEIFSLTLSEAAKLRRARNTDTEDYASLVKRVETGTVTLEEFLMLRTAEKQNTTSEEIREMIYATEFEPPELPNQIDGLVDNIEKAKMLVTPANPTSFDTKKVGNILEAELAAAKDGQIHVRSSLTLVNYLGKRTWGQEMAETEMPRFTVQSINTSLNLSPDSPVLIGSISPPDALQPEGEKRVWLAYVTVSKSQK